MADLALRARDLMAASRADATKLTQTMGAQRAQKLLIAAQHDLEKRLKAMKPGTEDSFTATQMRATLSQITLVVHELTPKLQSVVIDVGQQAAEQSATNSLAYLRRADKLFRGVGDAPLALDEASIMDAATHGARSSILRRLASSGESVVGADAKPHRAKSGILTRYGLDTIDNFEGILRVGLVTKKSFSDMRNEIRESSPFLKGAPMSWAHRIVRTELAASYNRSGYEAIRKSNEELGDMLKINSAVDDDRTGADSLAVHGQIRLPEEPFDTWNGPTQHPPDRPNDRALVVPHRKSWAWPEYLEWFSDEEVAARWELEGHKGEPPERPLMTTVPLDELVDVPDDMFDIQS